MDKPEKTRQIVWMELRHYERGDVIQITFEQGKDELFVPDDEWEMLDTKIVGMWS